MTFAGLINAAGKRIAAGGRPTKHLGPRRRGPAQERRFSCVRFVSWFPF